MYIYGNVYICVVHYVYSGYSDVPWRVNVVVYLSLGQDIYILVLLHGCNDIYVREGVHSVIFNYRRRLVIFISDCLNDVLFFENLFRKNGVLHSHLSSEG